MNELMATSKNNQVTYRRPLNDQQIETLHVLYWYRFCTSKQLARLLNKANHKAIQNKLQILEAQGLIGKRYESSYKLAGRAAEYFITPQGARQLEKRKPGTTNRWTDKSLYKNRTVSDNFLKHSITVTETAMKLNQLYGSGKQWDVVTKCYMAQLAAYPAWTPDLHLEAQENTDTTTRDCFIDIWDDTAPFFVSVRKTRNYVRFRESGEWYEDAPFPVILAVCYDERLQYKLGQQMRRILKEQDDEELLFATTTIQQLMAATTADDKVWLAASANDRQTTSRLMAL